MLDAKSKTFLACAVVMVFVFAVWLCQLWLTFKNTGKPFDEFRKAGVEIGETKNELGELFRESSPQESQSPKTEENGEVGQNSSEELNKQIIENLKKEISSKQ